MNNNTPQVGPVVAGDTVAVIADAFNTIYAFSKTTGKTLWTKHIWASRLASDGNYFYVVRTAYWDLEALDPGSGNIAWSLQLPDLGPGYLPFLVVHDGLLFTVNLVIDISRKAIVHQWSRESFFLDRIAFGNNGSIFLAGTSGTRSIIAIYDKNFNQIGRLVAGKGRIEEIVPIEEQIVVMLEQADPYGTRTTLTLLTQGGKRLWAIRWHSEIHGFSLLGGKLLIIGPEQISGKHRLISRQTLTGKLNWTTGSRTLFGIPTVCGDTVYATDGNHLHSFDLDTGKETTTGLLAKH